VAILIFNVFGLMALASFAAVNQPVHIDLKHGSEREQKTKVELERILGFYDLAEYTFTYEVMIDETSIPHSHPLLTLHTRHLGSDDELLSAYVHEQLHWYLDAHKKETLDAENKLQNMYPKVPSGFPEGGQDTESTYLHLINCYLEIQADRKFMGAERTDKVISSMDHYTWVYQTIRRDEAKIATIVDDSGLTLSAKSSVIESRPQASVVP